MPPAGLLSEDLVLAVLVVLLAGLMRGFAGFGSAMVTSPLYGLIYGPVQGVATVMLLETGVTLLLLPEALPRTRWRDIGPMSLAAVLAVPLGSFVLITADADVMRRVIASVVLVFALVMLRGWRYRGSRRVATTAGVGLMSGTMAGSVGMGGPPVILYLLSGPDAAAQNRANIITFFAIVGAMVLASLVVAGAVGVETVWRAALLMLPFLAAAHAGRRLFRHANEVLYRRVALYFLLAVALGTLLA